MRFNSIVKFRDAAYGLPGDPSEVGDVKKKSPDNASSIECVNRYITQYARKASQCW